MNAAAAHQPAAPHAHTRITATAIVTAQAILHLDATAPRYVGERRGVRVWTLGALRESVSGTERSRRTELVLGASVVAQLQAARAAGGAVAQ